MPVKRRVSVGLVFGMLTLAAAGCSGGGDSLPREPISGTVTFAGAPLGTGTLQFFPLKNDGIATVAFGQITDGKYSIPREQGLVPGAYKVIISSAPSGGTEASEDALPGPEAAKPPPKDMIPAKYNSNTTLNIEIKAGEENVHNFDLKR